MPRRSQPPSVPAVAPSPTLRKFAVLATRAKMHAKALELWSKIVADPGDCSAWYNVAGAHAGLEDVGRALAAYEARWRCRCAPRRCGRPRERGGDVHSTEAAGTRRTAARRSRTTSGPVATPVHALYNLNTALRRVGDQRGAVAETWRCLGARAAGFRARRVRGGARPAGSIAAAAAGPHGDARPAVVVCVKWGTKYSADYANKLGRRPGHLGATSASRATRRTPRPRPGRRGGAGLPTATTLEAWWLRPSSSRATQTCEAASSTDTVVCGPLALAAFDGDGLGVLGTDDLANENRAGGYNSSVLQWTAPDHHAVWDLLAAEPDAYATLTKCVYKFDHWLEMLFDSATVVQAAHPGLVAEYKRDVQPTWRRRPTARASSAFPSSPSPDVYRTDGRPAQATAPPPPEPAPVFFRRRLFSPSLAARLC